MRPPTDEPISRFADMTDYRVSLDIYNGPMDLLLYLIRRDELDIHDIPIARITEQYCAYVETLKLIDPDVAGEFLVLAATLMEIKTRMLLPRPEAEEEAEPFDPRAELVRQLLEFKAFKDAAGDLRAAAADQALRFPRRPGEPTEAGGGKDLEEVQIWDLLEAFGALLTAIGTGLGETEIIYDDTPIELHATDILDRLARDGNLSFREIFAGRTQRAEVVGLFLALLELIRRQAVYVEQQTSFGEIYVFANPDAPPPEQVAAQPAQEADETAGQPAAETESPPPAEAQAPAQTEDTHTHERRGETQGDGN